MTSRTRSTLPRRTLLLSAMLIACLGSAPALADDFPSRPIKLIVPFSPAGGTDVIARIVGQKLSEKLGTTIIVENRPGAAGTIGAGMVAKADPDGYTLLLYHIAMVTAHHIQKISFDPMKDFTPIGMVAAGTNVVAINSELPFKTLAELVDYAKKEPGKLHFGSSGTGGSDHLGGEMMQLATEIKMTHVPYKGGGPANAAAASGEIQMTAGTIAQSAPLIRAGKLRPLVVMQKDRSAALPDVPSAAESGYPNLNYTTWFGMWGPANMPPAVLAKISTNLKETLETPAVQDALRKAGVEPSYSTPGEFTASTRQQYDQWNVILKGKFTTP